DGSAGTSLYVKESGTGNTGWAALGTGTSGISGTTGHIPQFSSSSSIGDTDFTYLLGNLSRATLGTTLTVSTQDNSGGNAGNVSLITGNSTSGNGGIINLIAGQGSAVGGNVNILMGKGTTQ